MNVAANHEEEAVGPGRVSKRDLIRGIAERAGVPIRTADRVYEALLVEVVGLVRQGTQVNLSGFGRFYPQVHKGHHAQFGASGKGRLPDYQVLKFSASRTLSDFLALDDEAASTTRVPGTTLTMGQGPATESEPAAEETLPR